MAELEDWIVDQVLREQQKSGRTIAEILEAMRDEGYLILTEPELKDCIMQCELAR